jgi:hypothetical protein
MRVAVLQPTYLPWSGYFGMIDAVDTFIFYDDVQFSSQSWQQRNRVKSGPGQWTWLSVHILHQFGQRINEVRINETSKWRTKHWRSILQSYGKAPFFGSYKKDVEDLFQNDWKILADLNMALIRRLCDLLGLRKPTFLKSSDLEGLTGARSERLLDVLRRVGADEYVGNPGSRSYLNASLFREKGINLYWFEYQHPVYPQIGGEFIPYLSVVDLLFNTGEKAREFIREGTKNALKMDDSFTEDIVTSSSLSKSEEKRT